MDNHELEDKLIKMDTVNQCAISHHGEELLKENGVATHSLQPPHNFIPWIIFNGVGKKR